MSRILITAGPTHEPIDAVRYLGNRSSGRLGLALAGAAARRGHATTLLLGPTAIEPPPDSQFPVVRFLTTGDLEALLAEHWPGHDVLIMAAAVADYRPRGGPAEAKRPRGGKWTLELEPTPDLLAAAAAASRPDQVTVGFALGPAGGLAASTRKKLRAKGVDAIVANPLETMEDDRIDATLFFADGREQSPGACTKQDFAEWLLERIETATGRTDPSSRAAPGNR